MSPSPCSIVTIGNFDGVHSGHRYIIEHLKKFASSRTYREKFFSDNPELLKQYRLSADANPASCLITFKPHPAEILGNKFFIPLMTYEKRLETLKNFNLHTVEEIPFTKDFANKSAEEFCAGLVKKYKAAMLFIGHDLKVGHDRAGKEKLMEIGKKMGFAVYAHKALTQKNTDGSEVIVSSTKIREALLSADIPKANSMLGYAYSLSGRVRHGFKRGGKLLGFPTANLLEDTLVVPKNGVYATKTRIFDPRFPHEFHSMTNIGCNPTFNGKARSIETFIIDFDADIYGCDIEISFYKFLREEQKFNSLQELTAQLNSDVQHAQKVLTGK